MAAAACSELPGGAWSAGAVLPGADMKAPGLPPTGGLVGAAG